MKLEVFKSVSKRFILLATILGIAFSCQSDDFVSDEVQSKKSVKFAIDDSGKILENIPTEILVLMTNKFESANEKDKLLQLRNTYNFATGNLTDLALQSTEYLKLKNEYVRDKEKLLKNNKNGIPVGYRAYVAGNGWLAWTPYGEIIGTTGQHKRLEAIEFNSIPAPQWNIGIAHLAGLGWYDQAPSRTLGTTGQSRQMEAINLGIAGYYRAYVAGIGWLPWVSAGEVAGTTGQNRRMEAFQLINFNY